MTLANITSRGRAPLRQARVPGDGPTDPAGRSRVPFVRFEFPHDPAVAASSKQKQPPPGDGDGDDDENAEQRLEQRRFFSGHFDAYCPWRMDDPSLATEAFSADVGYARLHYVVGALDEAAASRAARGADHASSVHSLTRPRSPTKEMAATHRFFAPIREYPYDPATALEKHLVPTGATLQTSPGFTHYKSKAILEDPVELEAFAEYVSELKPRCAHDLKPLCYLLQSLLTHVLGREMDFFSSEIRELRYDVLRLRSLLSDEQDKSKRLEVDQIHRRWKHAARQAATEAKSARAAEHIRKQSSLDHDTHLLRLADGRLAEIEELRARLAEAESKLSGKSEDGKALRKEIKDLKRDKQKLQKSLDQAAQKAEAEKKTLRSVSAQKDAKIAELTRQIGELTETSDVAAKMAALGAECDELKRQLEEGNGLAVERGDYEAFAAKIRPAERADEAEDEGDELLPEEEEAKEEEDVPRGGEQESSGAARAAAAAERRRVRAERVIERLERQDADRATRSAILAKLSAHEAARVLQALGDWAEAGAMLRKTSVDFASDVLACGVLDHADVRDCLSNLSDKDGRVLFAMLRKGSVENVAGAIKAAHPTIAGGWLASAASQAKERLAIGDQMGVDTLYAVTKTLSEDDVVLLLDTQTPEVLAKVCEKMYYANELGDAVDALQRCTGLSRTRTLNAMDDVVRDEFLRAINADAEGDDDDDQDDLQDDGLEGGANAGAGERRGGLRFDKPVLDDEISDESRKVEHMTVPRPWLEYCGCARQAKLLRMWEAEDFKLTSPIKLRATLTSIYLTKLRHDQQMVAEGKARIPLPEYVVQWFDTSYGLRKLAQKKMAIFVYSLQDLYEKNVDRRVRQFVRLCGLYHPVPAVMCDLLLECIQIIASQMSGPGEPFRGEEEFFATWTNGKMISVPREKQFVIFTKIFGARQSATELLSRLKDELEDHPETVPDYIVLNPGSVSLSRYVEYTLKLVLEMNLASHDDVALEFARFAGDDFLDFDEFKAACEHTRPVRRPSESAYAFMYWRALTIGSNPKAGEVIRAVGNSADALERAGGAERGEGKGVPPELGVATFMWHCGQVNAVGVDESVAASILA